MAHPIYRNKKGERLPSVTTILSRFKESGGLVHWAWQLGMEGKDYRKVRDEAASAGSLAHEMVEADIKLKPMPVRNEQNDAIWDKANAAYSAYVEWRKQTQLVAEYSEVSLVCECHQVGGTLDTILVRGKRSMGDWKTSNAIYPEYLIQLAAYKHLWEVNNPDKPIDGGFHLLRFAKDSADFTHHYWGKLDEAWEAFVRMRELYDIMNRLKERL